MKWTIFWRKLVVICFESCFYLLEIFNIEKKNKKITIEVDISGILNGRGPANFIKGIYDILPYRVRKCNFNYSKTISPFEENRKSNYYFIPYPRFNELIYNKWISSKKVNKLILGPCFLPSSWKSFPNKRIWKERRFLEILKQVKGIAVHSERVRNYLSKRTNTINLSKKYIIIRPCTNIKPKNIKPFFERKIDILFFEKYQDYDYSQQGKQILNLFKNTSKKIESLKYGSYTKEKMEYLANNTKFIIYFSFFDTGAIGLKEIQNYGVFAFSHQRDLIIHERTGYYVPELANKNDTIKAFKIIMTKIQTLTYLNPNTQSIATINQEINKCQKALDDLCENIL